MLLVRQPVMDHAVDGKIIHRDEAVVVDNLLGKLMDEIIAPKSDAFMNPGDDFPAPGPLGGSFGGLAQFSLNFSQGLFLFPEEPRVFDDGS